MSGLVELEKKRKIWKEKKGNCLIVVDSMTGEHINVDLEVANYPHLERMLKGQHKPYKPRFSREQKLNNRIDNIISQLKSGKRVRL